MIYRITLLLAILLYACNTPHRITQNHTPFIQNGIRVTMEENEQEIIFKIQNTNNYPVVMAQPDQLTLQQQQGEQWQRVRTLYCPCGASCPSPREFVELSPEAFTLLSWDKKESWCVHNTPQRIPETAEKPAEKGNYRLVVSCGQHPKTTHTIYYEFKLN